MTFFKNQLPLLIALGILAIGLGLRLYHFHQIIWIQSGFDDQRDMLVARHLVSFGESIHRGPLAAGGFNWLQNSPGYYYLTAVMWLITRSPAGFALGFLLLTGLVIPLSYVAGTRLADKKTGLLAALFCAINPQLVSSSRMFSQPYLLPLCLLLFFWNISYQPTFKRICLSIFLLLLPLHFHYGILLFLPAGFYWIITDWLSISPTKVELNRLSVTLFSPLIAIILLGLIWIFSSFNRAPFDQLQILFLNFTSISHQNIIAQVSSSCRKFFELIWGSVTFWTISGTIGLFGLGYSWFTTHAKNPASRRVRNIFLSMLGSYLLVFLFRGTLQTSYVVGFLPFELLALALGIRWFIQKNLFVGVFILLVVAFSLLKNSLENLQNYLPQPSIYQQLNDISQAIYLDYRLQPTQVGFGGVPSLGIATLLTANQQPYDGWGTPGVWFWLEIKFQQQLVRLTDYGSNFQPLNLSPKYLYLICDHRGHPEKIQVECLDRFQKVRNYLTNNYREIGETADFTAWRFQTSLTTANSFGYYFTYLDLLNH